MWLLDGVLLQPKPAKTPPPATQQKETRAPIRESLDREPTLHKAAPIPACPSQLCNKRQPLRRPTRTPAPAKPSRGLTEVFLRPTQSGPRSPAPAPQPLPQPPCRLPSPPGPRHTHPP